jgi:hypothetical protein
MMAFKSLMTSRRFWLAVVAVLTTVVAQYVPNFPPAIWQAVLGLVGLLVVALTVDDVAAVRAGLHPVTLQPLPFDEQALDEQPGDEQ